MTAGTGKARALVRALPLALLDAAATVAAFLVGAWATQVLGALVDVQHAALYLAFLALVNVAVFALGGMYGALWEYASVEEAARVVLVTAAGSLAGDALAALFFGERLPLRVYVVAWLVLVVVCGAARFAIRLYSGKKGWSVLGIRREGGQPRSLVVGAGETGSLTVGRMLAGNPDVPGFPVGLVDDDPAKAGGRVHGVKVLGTCGDIPRLARELSCEQVVVACPSATWAERQRILGLCARAGARTLTLPLLADMPREAGAPLPLREVEVSDLLARDEVALDLGQMGYVAGKGVLVTGGGGSIGSELVRQLIPARPSRIVLFDVYENTAYELYHEIRGACAEAGIDLRVEIGSITHLPAITKAFDDHRPDVVFHAAAHKHVPLMEANAREAVENNVFGTLNVARLAHERGCTHFVLVSTDKAVNPTNVMGATKRMCEMVVQRYAAASPTVFTAVRFGNVLGSHGSVIPLFKRQLKEGGPITVTHRDITRYFMTIPEASRLVIAAGALAKGGEVFVLDMGEPVRIWDLAENLVRLSGLKPGRDVEIVETGLRPGEKMYEELLMGSEHLVETPNRDIRVSTGDAVEPGEVEAKLDLLRRSLDLPNDDIKRALAEAVPTYTPDLKGEE